MCHTGNLRWVHELSRILVFSHWCRTFGTLVEGSAFADPFISGCGSSLALVYDDYYDYYHEYCDATHRPDYYRHIFALLCKRN